MDATQRCNKHSTDIIATVAWACGERGCPGVWHQSNYWIDDTSETGYTLDNYSDGDHDEIDPEDLPTPEEVVQSWKDYAVWVAETGRDPLGNYMVPRDVTHQTRHYTVTLSPSITGPVVIRLRRNHRTVDLNREITNVRPVHDYLMAVRTGSGRWVLTSDMDDKGEPVLKLGSILRLEDIAANQPGTRIRNHRLVAPFTVEVPRPDAEARLSRWLKATAA